MTTSSLLLVLLAQVPTAEQLAGHHATLVEKPPAGFVPMSNAMGAADREPHYVQDGKWQPKYAHTSTHWTPSRPKSVETLLDIYYVSVGRGVPLVVEGGGPNLTIARRMIDATFRDDLARTEGAKRFDHIVLMEDLTRGQRIERWSVDAMIDGEWRTMASGEAIGARRIVRIEPVTATQVRLTPAMASLSLHLTPRIAREPVIQRGGDGVVTIATYGQKVRYTTDGSEPTAASPAYVTPIPVPPGGEVKAVVLQEDNPKIVVLAERLVARQRFGLAKTGWKIVSFDSEERRGEDGRAANAIDDNPQTFWHTQWADASPRHPHEIVIDLSAETEMSSLGYLPRQDGTENGTIDGYELFVSADGKAWGAAVATGRFEGGDGERTVKLPVGTRARFVRLVATSEVNGNPWTSAAEINLYR